MHASVTITAAKATGLVSRLLGRGGGGALPGLVADRLDQNLAGRLAAQLPHGVILVTGTNGKTTTTKLIAAALTANGERVLSNRSGSNLRRGVVSSLVRAADVRGHLKATIGLFEVDEASLRRIAPQLNPQHIVVLNLFRDQLDRYGELDTTAALIGEGIAATSAKVYLNADDPLVASLAAYAKPGHVQFFGIEGLPAASTGVHPTATDSDRCPICHRRLLFTRTFYGHIGHYRCQNNDFDRPQPSTAITSVENLGLGGSRFAVAVSGKRYQGQLPLPGTYNLYNALATVAVAAGLELAIPQTLQTLADATAAFGRVERIVFNERTLYLLLIKNPAGFSQVLETFLLGVTQPHVLLAINDEHADGRDVSWLWDVPLEALEPLQPVLTVSGIRGTDMAVRLKYAGVTPVMTQPLLPAALDAFVAGVPAGGTGYILPTYTAMVELRRLLGQRTAVAKVDV